MLSNAMSCDWFVSISNLFDTFLLYFPFVGRVVVSVFHHFKNYKQDVPPKKRIPNHHQNQQDTPTHRESNFNPIPRNSPINKNRAIAVTKTPDPLQQPGWFGSWASGWTSITTLWEDLFHWRSGCRFGHLMSQPDRRNLRIVQPWGPGGWGSINLPR